MIKVENYLMLSEYEQNLLKETEGPVGLIGGRRGRRGEREINFKIKSVSLFLVRLVPDGAW